MKDGSTTKLIAACFGMAAFSVAIISGLAVGNPANRILISAILSMFVCQFVGMLVGSVAEWLARDFVATYKHAHTVPDIYEDSTESGSVEILDEAEALEIEEAQNQPTPIRGAAQAA